MSIIGIQYNFAQKEKKGDYKIKTRILTLLFIIIILLSLSIACKDTEYITEQESRKHVKENNETLKQLLKNQCDSNNYGVLLAENN